MVYMNYEKSSSASPRTALKREAENSHGSTATAAQRAASEGDKASLVKKWSRHFKDITGERYGQLIVICRASAAGERLKWKCKCECGAQKTINGSAIKSGKTTSCGCAFTERAGKMNFRHGKYKSRAYSVWEGIIQRCNNQKSTAYENYGARGISVCPEWSQFQQFYKDMGDPSENTTIERNNNNLGYSKENCRWATRPEQDRNRRTSINITIEKETLCVAQWAARIGVSKGTIYSRIKAGKDPQSALMASLK